MVKKILCAGILVMALMFVISCGERGGTIVIENEIGSPVWSVGIGKKSDVPNDTVDLQPGNKYEKSFSSNGTYYAFGYFKSGWRSKSVSLNGGETVIIKGDNF